MEKIHYAGFWVRFIAIILDTFLILTPITLLLGLIFGFDALREPNPQIGILQVVFYGTIICYYWVSIGQTPGQKAFHIVLVNSQTQKTIGYTQAFWRFAMYFVSIASVAGILLPLFRKDKKCLHDLLANTTVRYVV